jgi:tetratricopeptide (TPR) repeat protein
MKGRPFLLGLLTLALALRIAYFLQIRENPFLETPDYDARNYSEWAREIAGGKLVWDEFRIHAPGYPYFLALFSKLTGHDFAVMTFANSILALLWIALLYSTARRTFSSPAPEIAALLAATYWVFLHFEGQLLAETLFLTLEVSSLYFLTRFLDHTKAHTPSGVPVALLLAGGCLGLASVTRPNGLAPVPFVSGILLFGCRAALGAGLPGRREFRNVLFFLGAFALFVVPVLLRNHALSGMVALQHHTAFNFYLGNRPGAPGFHAIRPGREWDRLSAEPERVAGAKTLAEHNDYFLSRALEFARQDPKGFALLQLRKLRLFVNAHEVRSTLSPYFFERFAPLQASFFLPNFAVVAPLGALGLALSFRMRPRPWLLYSFLFPGAVLVILTVVDCRYRLPTVAFLLPFAGYALSELLRWVKTRKPGPLAFSAVILAGTTFVVTQKLPELQHENFAEELARVAWVFEQKGEGEEAAEWWVKSFEEDPERIDSYVGYGNLALSLGHYARVEEVTREGLRRSPGDRDLLRLRGKAFLLAGVPDSALASFSQLLPEPDADLLADVARAEADLGNRGHSLELFRRSLELDPGDIDVLNDTATLLLEIAELSQGAGREAALAKAILCLEAARDKAPQDESIAAQLARARAMTER